MPCPYARLHALADVPDDGRPLPRPAAPPGARQERPDRDHRGHQHRHPRHRPLGGDLRRAALLRRHAGASPARAVGEDHRALGDRLRQHLQRDPQGGAGAGRRSSPTSTGSWWRSSARPGSGRPSWPPRPARRRRRVGFADAARPPARRDRRRVCSSSGPAGASPRKSWSAPTCAWSPSSDRRRTTTSRCAPRRPSFLTGCAAHAK